nr:reverse transcriptase domain-containing protein [Tanacetum cinerariifolium]
DMIRALNLDKKNQSSASAHSPTHAPVKAVNQPPAYQASAYQAPIPQTQSVSKTDFESYIKANDAVLRNMQNQGQNVQNQCQSLQIRMANLIDMLSKFVSFNTASSSGSRTLPSNTITNPKEELNGGDNERRRDQANEQTKKFYEIFKDMGFEISFTDALILMPKFASALKALIGNKEKLSEMARTPMNEHCSAVILNKLPRKLGDPVKFLIPYRSVSKPIGITKDVSVKVGVFHFPADFVVVDFKPDPRVPLILRRPWISPVHCVPKDSGFTVVENEENKLIPTCLVTGWRVCIDYRKLNEATRKDHFPLPFMDQMLERLAGNEYYCFLDGFSWYFQIPIDLHD